MVFFGICNFAIVLGTTAGVSYIVDCNRHTTDAALGALIFWVSVLLPASAELSCLDLPLPHNRRTSGASP